MSCRQFNFPFSVLQALWFLITISKCLLRKISWWGKSKVFLRKMLRFSGHHDLEPYYQQFLSSAHLAYERTTVKNVAVKILAWEWHAIDRFLSVFLVVFFLAQHSTDRTYMKVKLLCGVLWIMGHNSPLSLPFRSSDVFTLKSQLGPKSTVVQLLNPHQQWSTSHNSWTSATSLPCWACQ